MASEAPKVSVVIPTHNRAEMLVRAVRSALDQTLRDLEIIVVDDGSTDDTSDRLAELASDGRIRVVTRARASGRPAVARNAGIVVARGELVAFLDSDDTWYPDKLAKQVAHLDDDPACALVSGRCRWVGQEERLWPELPKRAYRYEDLVAANVIACSMTVVRRRVLSAVGGFDTSPGLRLGEDWDLWLRIAQAHPFVVLPDVLGDYAVHEGGVSRHKARELWGLISVLTRLSSREPRWHRATRRRIRALRRELARELWAGHRYGEAIRVLVGVDRTLQF